MTDREFLHLALVEERDSYGKKIMTVCRLPDCYSVGIGDEVIIEDREIGKTGKLILGYCCYADSDALAFIKKLSQQSDFPRVLSVVRQIDLEYPEDKSDGQE